MSECVILFRNLSNSSVGFIHDGEEADQIYRFSSMDEAVSFAEGSDFLQCGQVVYQIVELDEL